MAELEEKLGQLLSNPDIMQQIQSLAQNLGGAPPPAPAPGPPKGDFPLGNLDPAMLAKLAGLAQKSGIDPDQRSLLCALHPYLSPRRIGKLGRAMQAAKLAELASGFFESGGLHALTGR